MHELSKGFDHAVVDPKWYAVWEARGAFRANPDSGKPPFVMVIPPPNVTGSLHIGHALNHTLPDILARWKRMQGFDVLWLPGTDHAGIATQNVVEKQLALEGKTRHDLGREAFEARVWAWVKQSHGTITGQMRRLGESVDWSRERFTLDENLSRAVRRVFVTLYREGLIYRDKYLVNWCPRCGTAISDLEVVHRDVTGKLYHVRYPYTNGDGFLVVATTRPETMLGDTAIAVHPDDDRYRARVGQSVRLPIIGRDLPIIADTFVDAAFGTGAVKATPAHDPNDFALGLRHNLPQVSVIDETGRMTVHAGPYAGQDRFKARAAIVEQLEKEGLLEKVEPHRHAVGHCQRCNTVVEPLLSTQWFVKIKPLADEAIRAVEDGRIRFLPENWAKTYFEWMRNIHDWCISRQLWWGHRIPAWYCDACGKTIVSEDAQTSCECGGALRQDTDVLDTWFSSGLWPFSTMGWPDETRDLQHYYPTTVMLTAFDIIFFWVARMIMFGLKFTGREPFTDVYITALVRDEHGQKMSKSKGNVVDPLEVMDDIGADAFRFTLAALASPGMDIALAEGRLTGYRQFINKLWNVSRFALLNLAGVDHRPLLRANGELGLIHRWILHRSHETTRAVNAALTEYRFDTAAHALYHFLWDEYADWYVELVKSHLQPGAADREDAIAVLVDVHDRALRLFHPFIPYVTEEIWQQLPRRAEDGDLLTLAAYPSVDETRIDPAAAAEMDLLQEVTTAIRTVRAERGVPPSKKVRAWVVGAGPDEQRMLAAQAHYIAQLARLESLEIGLAAESGPDVVKRVVRSMDVFVSVAGAVDRGAELDRIQKDLASAEKELRSLDAKLGNDGFVARAPKDVVDEARTRHTALQARIEKLKQALLELQT